jgi:NAD(P)-dependent dehydrogenase (short-subunit alcohol dehydrogenase family)
MIGPLKGKVMIVTGASSGIGAATALAAARAGMRVVINARRADRLQVVADRIVAVGGEAEIVAGDVADQAVNSLILDAAERRFGRFDVVFANAGYGLERPLRELTDADLRRIFNVNYFSGADLLRLAANRLIERKRPGHLLMCSSCLAKFTLPLFGAYCGTKAAQAHYCRTLRFELRPFSIEVASVHPITTTTEFFEAASRESGSSDPATLPAHAPKMFIQPPERVARAIMACLKRPRSEVWTSLIVRTVAGFMTVFPPLMDYVIQRELRRLVDSHDRV